MPARSQLKRFAFAFILLFVTVNIGVFAFDFFGKNSVTAKRSKPPLRLSSFANSGDVQKLLKINLHYEAAASDENEIVEISAQVDVPFNYQFPIAYSWKLSDGVQLVEGPLKGELAQGISTGSAAVFKIKVKGFTKLINRHVWFEAKSTTKGHGVYGESMAASDFENSFENTVQNVERIKASE